MHDGNGVRRIEYASKYLRSFSKLPVVLQQRAREREALFRINPLDHRLETHKLHGKFRGLWAYSVDQKYRVVFRFIDGDRALFFDIGDHSIYR